MLVGGQMSELSQSKGISKSMLMDGHIPGIKPSTELLYLCIASKDYSRTHNIITECGSTLYLGITVEFLDNWVFDHGIIQANKLQKPTTRLQIDLHCLAVHKKHL